MRAGASRRRGSRRHPQLLQSGSLGHEKAADSLDPDILNIGGGCETRVHQEQACKLAEAHSNPFGKAVDAVIFGWAHGHPALHLLQS